MKNIRYIKTLSEKLNEQNRPAYLPGEDGYPEGKTSDMEEVPGRRGRAVPGSLPRPDINSMLIAKKKLYAAMRDAFNARVIDKSQMESALDILNIEDRVDIIKDDGTHGNKKFPPGRFDNN